MQDSESYARVLKNITTTFLAEQEDFYVLKEAVEQWKSLLYSLADLDLSREEYRENIHTDTGKAIGTTWAAMCLDDLLRTRRFIKGIFMAVEDLMKSSPQRPVRLLYAGCGPFAPLVQLLTTQYSPEEIQFTLLEINPHSYAFVKQVFKQLSLEEYLHNVYLCDAATVKLQEAATIDLIISETMQHALVKEQQVPITYNMLSQLREDVLLIPQSIRLGIGLLSSRRNHDRFMTQNYEKEFYRPLGTFFDLSKVDFARFSDAFCAFSNVFRFPEYRFQLHGHDLSIFDELVVLTHIHIYGDQHIAIDDSQLSIPLKLAELPTGKYSGGKVNYKVDAIPGIEFELY